MDTFLIRYYMFDDFVSASQLRKIKKIDREESFEYECNNDDPDEDIIQLNENSTTQDLIAIHCQLYNIEAKKYSRDQKRAVSPLMSLLDNFASLRGLQISLADKSEPPEQEKDSEGSVIVDNEAPTFGDLLIKEIK